MIAYSEYEELGVEDVKLNKLLKMILSAWYECSLKAHQSNDLVFDWYKILLRGL